MTIEEVRVKLNEAIHQYANAAVLVDRDGGAWDADVEPFDKVKAAITAAMMAVLEEACGFGVLTCIQYAKSSGIHARHQEVREEFAALGAPQQPPEQQEGA